MAEYNAPVPQVDPVLIEINRLFDEMVFCVNQRREAVLFMYNDLSQDIASRPIDRARRELELTVLRAENENTIRMNPNHYFQKDLLSDIDLQLAEIRTPQPDTRVVFRSQFVPLYKLIAELGEVLEEEIPVVPGYSDTTPVITVPDYPDTKPVITVPDYPDTKPVLNVPDYPDTTPVITVPDYSDTTPFITVPDYPDTTPVITVPDYPDTTPVITVPDYPDTKPVLNVPDYPDTTPFITVPDYSHMRPVVTVGKRGKAPGKLHHPYAVAIDLNRIFVAEGYKGKDESHARVSVFSQRGEFLASFSHQDMIWPWGIAIHGDNLYVSDHEAHSIFHFKTDTNFPLISKVGTRGRLVGKFNHPRNLAVSNNGDVYVADGGNNRVQIFTSSLLYLRNLTQQRIQIPEDIKLTADEVYVLCGGNPCLHVFSHAGEKLRSLISQGNKQMQVYYPLFFCLDSAENIIISDCLSHRIQIFTKEGYLITTIGEEGQQAGMLYLPRGIALTKELSLVVVSENDNFGIQIFSCL